ncbi:MAG: prepilin-type N-terminal cleavage/methylation domain-containing protein [Candidatus Omnitrophota bacterium]
MNRKGFTLVEIMIVVAIIALLAAIAIPNLLRARLAANESAAIAALRTLASAAHTYRAANPTYPEGFDNLTSGTPPYIDDVLGSGSKQGYNFTLDGDESGFTATAIPVSDGTTGNRRFFVDTSGVIRYTPDGAAPTATTGDPIE